MPCPYIYGKASVHGPITFYPIKSLEGQPIKFMIEQCRVCFVPSVFKGDGSESRLNLCLESGLGSIKIEQYESHLNGTICSAAKENYIKCKINLKTISLYNIDKKIENNEIDWMNLNCNCLIQVKGLWESTTQKGLQFECIALKVLAGTETPCPFA